MIIARSAILPSTLEITCLFTWVLIYIVPMHSSFVCVLAGRMGLSELSSLPCDFIRACSLRQGWVEAWLSNDKDDSSRETDTLSRGSYVFGLGFIQTNVLYVKYIHSRHGTSFSLHHIIRSKQPPNIGSRGLLWWWYDRLLQSSASIFTIKPQNLSLEITSDKNYIISVDPETTSNGCQFGNLECSGLVTRQRQNDC